MSRHSRVKAFPNWSFDARRFRFWCGF